MSTQGHLGIQDALDRLVRGLDPERVILYGSRATKEARPGSDVDLLLLADSGTDTSIFLHRARQLIARVFPPIDLAVTTPEQVDDAYAGKSPFLLSILECGVTVYRRPNRVVNYGHAVPFGTKSLEG